MDERRVSHVRRSSVELSAPPVPLIQKRKQPFTDDQFLSSDNTDMRSFEFSSAPLPLSSGSNTNNLSTNPPILVTQVAVTSLPLPQTVSSSFVASPSSPNAVRSPEVTRAGLSYFFSFSLFIIFNANSSSRHKDATS